MIYELLKPGKDYAVTGRQLSKMTGLSIRKLCKEIENERRAGHPICASTNSPPGYYLPADPAELETYCQALHFRAGNIQKTRRALLSCIKKE